MKKTVIVNYGKADEGKTQTIGKVLRILMELYHSSDDPKNINYSKNVKHIKKIKDLKIGIESMGDPEPKNILQKSLNEFVEKGCDLILCAARTYGKTFDAVFDLRDHGYDIIKVNNIRSKEKNHEKLNELSAKHIVELINELMSNKI